MDDYRKHYLTARANQALELKREIMEVLDHAEYFARELIDEIDCMKAGDAIDSLHEAEGALQAIISSEGDQR